MVDHFLGFVEALDWRSLGSKYAELTAQQRIVPIRRTRSQLARGSGGEDRWRAIADAARVSVGLHDDCALPLAAAFLCGAAEVGGEEMWQLLTLYELQVAELTVPRRWRRRRPVDGAADDERIGDDQGAFVAGCTGIACGGGRLGQTEEVDPHVYDYGAQDRVASLRLSAAESQAALVYDPACSFCPIGLSTGALCISRFTLYPDEPHDASSTHGFIPLAAVLWELLLSGSSLDSAVALLHSLFEGPKGGMASGAAMVLSEHPRGTVVLEWCRSALWVSPVVCEGALIRANHCLLGSSMRDDESAESLRKLLAASRERQELIESHWVEEFLATEALDVGQLQQALSLPMVQNDSVVATVVVCSAERALHVRFRLQVRSFGLVEQTVQRDLWHRFVDQGHGRGARPTRRWARPDKK